MGNRQEHLETRLAIISEIAHGSSASLGLDELLDVVYQRVAPYFEHEAFIVSQYDRAHDTLRMVFGVESGKRIGPTEISLEGLTGVVVRENRSLYVPNLDSRDPSIPPPVVVQSKGPIGSWLGVPLRIRDQVVGVLAISAEPKNAYDEDDEALLTTVADQLAVAIDNARLFGETRRQAERLALLNRVSRAVSRTLDPDELMAGLYEEIAATFDHDGFLVVRYDEPKREVQIQFGMTDGRRLPRGDRRPVGGFTGVVIDRRKTLHIRNYGEEKDRLPTPYMTEDESSVDTSWLGVPLVVGDRVLGALCVMADRPYAYDEDKVRLFETLADQIAFALSNAELFRSVRDAASRLEIVNRIGRVVGREHDLEQLAQSVHREIAPVFEADTFFIALVNEQERTIEFPFMIDEGQRTPSDPIPIGQGLTSTVIRTKKALHVRNAEEYVEAIGNPALFGSMRAPESWLGIPLTVEERVIGVINVQSYRPHAYTEDQALLLATIADQIAMSFEKARLLQMARREIDERARAEAQLAAERTLLRTIIDNIPDFIYAKDRDGRFTVANAAIARFFGFSNPDELLGKTIADLLPADEAAKYLDEERELLGTGNLILNTEEHVADRTTGESRWLLVTKIPLIGAQGRVTGLAGVDRDITARKRAEQEVKRYLAEVEIANEEVKQFAYIVSHDLRAPLVNLKGFSAELRDAMETLAPHLQRLLDGIDEAEREEVALLLEEDVPEALGFIETSVSRMDGFINSVLKLSRLGRRELALQSVDVGQYVETCRQSLAHQMEERGVELIVGDLPEVIADPTAMEQIIGNLLTNAVNYLVPDRPGRIEIGGEHTALGTRFWIKDNGRGIAKEDEEKVFAPFRRAGRQDVVGEGMGLSYVRTMVRQHGGQIWFESEPDVGTTFTFTIADRPEKGTRDGKPE